MRKLLYFLLLPFMLQAQIMQQGVVSSSSGGSYSIAHDADSSAGTVGNVSSFTWAHVMGAGVHGLLVCAVRVDSSFGSGTVTISSVTYNSSSLTQQQAVNASPSTSPPFTSSWIGYLVSPTTGSNTVSVTLSGTPGATSKIGAGCVSFTGVSQSTPVDSAGTSSTGTTGSPTLNVTTVSTNAWVVDMLSVGGVTTPTPTSPQVSSVAWTQATSFAMSYQGPIPSPSSTSDSWSAVGSAPWTLMAFSIKPG